MWLFSNIRLVLIATAVVAVVVSGFGLVRYGQSIEQQRSQIEIKDNYIATRKKIDEALRTTPPATPSDALKRLRDRQDRR